MLFGELQPILLTCDDTSSRMLPNGNRFIRHLAAQGPGAYLHSLYAPASRELQSRIETGWGRKVPPDVRNFLKHANGATLFDKTIHLYGYVESLSRSTELQDQTAISLLFENQTFAAAAPERWKGGWWKIGGLTGWSSILSLEAHDSGKCAIVPQQGKAAEHRSFAEMMRGIVDRVSPCFACSGVTDITYAELEAALVSLIQTQ